ncbi:hypothetical protein GCM10009839_32600 [Catenulispora yoronensis]|uniref:Uncharacterized protein n=1 Tax=Catenulispora yoronensis TaxID=450799 RepID=A0ABP5FMZ3_9ACTN
MTPQPLAPPSTDVTAMNWDDVKLFATEIGTLLADLQQIAPDLRQQSHFMISPGTFYDANQLTANTTALGTSLQSATTWMLRLLGDIQTGLTNAVTSLSGVDSLQKENGASLLSQIQNINTDLSSGPGSAAPAK